MYLRDAQQPSGVKPYCLWALITIIQDVIPSSGDKERNVPSQIQHIKKAFFMLGSRDGIQIDSHIFYIWVSVHRNSIIYKEPTRCNFWHYFLLTPASTLYMFHTISALIIRSTKNCSSSHWCVSWVGMMCIFTGYTSSLHMTRTSGCYYSF